MTTARKYRTRLEKASKEQLIIDPKIQRSQGTSRSHVTRMRAHWNPHAAGVLTVSRRANGRLIVIDGMHRREAAPPGFVFRVEVHEGLTLAEECELFRRLNDAKKLTAYDDFDKGVKGGDDESVAINTIVKKHGLKVNNQHTDGTIRAVSSLRNAYRRCGADALDRALEIITEAWGHQAAATEGQIVYGISMVAASHNGDLDDDALVKKLSKFPGGPSALLGSARGLKSLRPGSVNQHVAQLVVDVYNKGRRHKLAAAD